MPFCTKDLISFFLQRSQLGRSAAFNQLNREILFQSLFLDNPLWPTLFFTHSSEKSIRSFFWQWSMNPLKGLNKSHKAFKTEELWCQDYSQQIAQRKFEVGRKFQIADATSLEFSIHSGHFHTIAIIIQFSFADLYDAPSFLRPFMHACAFQLQNFHTKQNNDTRVVVSAQFHLLFNFTILQSGCVYPKQNVHMQGAP